MLDMIDCYNMYYFVSQADMEQYCESHPQYEPKVITTFLTKAEQKIKDEREGKPQKPPR